MTSPVTFTSAGGGGGGGTPSSLQRAYLELREPPADGSTAQPGGPIGRIDFQFNPKELSLSKNAKWKRDAQRNAKKSGPPEFTGSDPAKLTLEMFFDATEKMDSKVVQAVEKLFNCCVPTDASRLAKKGSPPWVIFHWGPMTGFPSYVSSVTAKYTLFTPSGTPVRAVCTVNLEEISGEQSGQNPTSGSRTSRRAHIMTSGDTLQSLSYRTYGNAGLWRVIAEANGVTDPMRIPVGTRLLVPAADELPGDGDGQ
ncbi:LysM peptidoglycan-binding domain-containing protein [Phytomonospora sp. NPDC050363]|uniref:CIS tube protein n=1 Tax=Phytomonospora sp. NPDC050363 TaxID=3155642 RepID=UPI0033F1CB00